MNNKLHQAAWPCIDVHNQNGSTLLHTCICFDCLHQSSRTMSGRFRLFNWILHRFMRCADVTFVRRTKSHRRNCYPCRLDGIVAESSIWTRAPWETHCGFGWETEGDANSKGTNTSSMNSMSAACSTNSKQSHTYRKHTHTQTSFVANQTELHVHCNDIIESSPPAESATTTSATSQLCNNALLKTFECCKPSATCSSRWHLMCAATCLPLRTAFAFVATAWRRLPLRPMYKQPMQSEWNNVLTHTHTHDEHILCSCFWNTHTYALQALIVIHQNMDTRL
jgi:hypothetical protein